MNRLPPVVERIDGALADALRRGALGPPMAEWEAERAAEALVTLIAEAADSTATLPSPARVRAAYALRTRDRRLRLLRGSVPAAAAAERFGLSARQVYRIWRAG